MGQIDGGCENLRYGFHYNADENEIEAAFLFTSEIPQYEEGIVDVKPFAHIMSFGIKQKGSKPAIDKVFDNPQKAAEITKRAEMLFSDELGWAIDRAMQLLVHEVLFRCGIDFKASPKLMADVLGQSYRKDIAQQLRVKVGRAGLFRDEKHYKETLYDVRARILAGGQRITQEAMLAGLAEMNDRFLYCDVRTLRRWNKEYNFDWKAFTKRPMNRTKLT
jgi:hypothetical protein